MMQHKTAGGSPLGNSARFSSAREELNPKDIAAKQRFELQRKAQRLLPNERIAQCMRRLTPDANYVVCWADKESGSAGFKNLMTCDSYSCPVCAAKRSEQDRRLLSVALAQATLKGYHPVMITFTASHFVGDTLEKTKDGIASAFDATFSGRWYNDLREEWGIVGKIKAWEQTYGKNGWHPHIHVLMFLEFDLSEVQIANLHIQIGKRYLAALEKRGFHADLLHGVDVRTAQSDIADYIAKFGREPKEKAWGADSEIAKIPTKRAGHDGLTPFEVLAAANGDKEPLERLMRLRHIESSEIAQKLAESLYCEFFYCMKNTARLFWSKGLKELLEVETALISLEAAEPDIYATAMDMVMIEAGENWQRIIGRWDTRDLRAELLQVLRTADIVEIDQFLSCHGVKYINLTDTLIF